MLSDHAFGKSFEAQDAAAVLLRWYDAHGRALPWRAKGGLGDPYRVWLSEIMLQQTTVAAVKNYFQRFTAQWPTVADLAGADLDAVLRAWAGLGYYARARNLHKCAQILAAKGFPSDEAGWLALPGVGPYTAAAVASIAFGRRAVVVDGNVERVMARLRAIETPLPAAKPAIRAAADALTPHERPGCYAQAVMDLGATICAPRSPACGICPWMDLCQGRRAGLAPTLPRKAPKAVKPTRYGIAYVLENPDGAALLRRRPEKGLLGGMIEPPVSEWGDAPPAPGDGAPLIIGWAVDWRSIGEVRHTFTHFHLRLSVVHARARHPLRAADIAPDVWFAPRDTLFNAALPTVMKKVLCLAPPLGESP